MSSSTINSMAIDSQNAEQLQKGLAQLALQIINLLRQLIERQVIKRMDSLPPTKQEEMGIHLKILDEKMKEMRQYFGITDDQIKLGLMEELDEFLNTPLKTIEEEIRRSEK